MRFFAELRVGGKEYESGLILDPERDDAMFRITQWARIVLKTSRDRIAEAAQAEK